MTDAYSLLFRAFMDLLNQFETDYIAARKDTMDAESAELAFAEDIGLPALKKFLFSDRPLTQEEIEYGKSLAPRVREALGLVEPEARQLPKEA